MTFQHTVRNPSDKVSHKNRRRPRFRPRPIYDTLRNAALMYDGAPAVYEDLADYFPRGLCLKGTVLA